MNKPRRIWLLRSCGHKEKKFWIGITKELAQLMSTFRRTPCQSCFVANVLRGE